MAYTIENNSGKRKMVDSDYFGKSFTEDDVQETLDDFSNYISRSGDVTVDFSFRVRTLDNHFNEGLISFNTSYSIGEKQGNLSESYVYIPGQTLGVALLSFLTRFSDETGIDISSTESNSNSIDPNEIAYMPADEFSEGYKYNRFTGKIIEE